jgi:hypothetical protein
MNVSRKVSVQQSLFDPGAKETQRRELERVATKIDKIVHEFCSARVGLEFTMAELHSYVNTRTTSAPDSAGRILRLLRREGKIRYSVVHRADSRYKVLEVMAWN